MLQYSDDVEDGLFDYNYDNGENYTHVEVTWPTPSGITESEAQQACEEAMAVTGALDFCKEFIDIDTISQWCVTDIQVRQLG